MTAQGSNHTRISAVDFAFQAITLADSARLGRVSQIDLLGLARQALTPSAYPDLQAIVSEFIGGAGSDKITAGQQFRTQLGVWLNAQDLDNRVEVKAPKDGSSSEAPVIVDLPGAPAPERCDQRRHVVHEWMSRRDTGFD